MSRPYEPVFRDDRCRQWHELYQGWLAYSELTNEERKNRSWGRLKTLGSVLSGEIAQECWQR